MYELVMCGAARIKNMTTMVKTRGLAFLRNRRLRAQCCWSGFDGSTVSEPIFLRSSCFLA